MAKTKLKPMTDVDFERARLAGEAKREAGLCATSVQYDREARRIVMELTNGVSLAVPVARLKEIAGATDDVLSEVTLLGQSGIHFESLDADYSVAGLVLDAIGRSAAASEFARAGGSASTESKAAAARLNGARGGRPRTVNSISTTATASGPAARASAPSRSISKTSSPKVTSPSPHNGKFTIKKPSKRP